MKNSKWWEWLRFSKRERNGIIVLASLLIVLLIYRYTEGIRPPSDHEKSEFFNLRQTVAAWKAQQNFLPQSEDTLPHNPPPALNREKATATKPFPFNPNHLPDSVWLRLGLSPKQISGIRRYEKKGGIFRIKKDLKKMYSVPPELYVRWESWIALPDSLPVTYAKTGKFSAEVYDKKKEKNIISIELNAADTLLLQSLPGIGSYFAKKIADYRQRLGGFLQIEQLLEIKKMTPELLEKITPFITINPSFIHPLNLNLSPEEDFLNHPYLSKNQAKSIIAYRAQHGDFTNIEELRQVILIDEFTFARLKPYIVT